jgi:CRISPR-associated endonuclease Csn1
MRNETSSDGGPIFYSEAVARAGLHHSDFRDGEILDELPYYGAALRRYTAEVKSKTASEDEKEYGRLANPTVHVTMNQVRACINNLISAHGHPERIVVEVARDLQAGAEELEEIRKKQSENKKKNDERRKKLEELEQRVTPLNLLRLRLWEELGPAHDRRCIYTGRSIGCAALFLKDGEVEIEHILPFQQSLDDSPANLTVSYRSANRDKGNKTPSEAFKNHQSYQWDNILLRASNLPPNKQWRFREDALELVKSRTQRAFLRARAELPAEVLDDIDRSGGFLARQLVDTAYAARLIQQYLWKVCDPNKVSVTPGRLTALLRSKWGLGLNALLGRNEPEPGEGQEGAQPKPIKMRSDHRHHAVDAFVVAMTDFATLLAVSNAADQKRNRLIENMPPPWPGFRLEEIAGPLRRMVVSHKPEHGIGGRFLQQTAYGPSPVEGANIVVRKPIDKLSVREVNRICDERLRSELKDHLGPLAFDEEAIKEAKSRYKEARGRKDRDAAAEAKAELDRLDVEKKAFKKTRKESRSSGKDLQKALAEFGRTRGVKRIRVFDQIDKAALRWEFDSEKNPYKAYQTADNHHVDVFERADGSLGAEVVALVDANRRGGYAPEWKKGDGVVRRYGRFHKGDLVRMEVNGTERIFRVVSIWEKYLQLAEHFETDLAERYKEKQFKWTFANYNDLRERKLRKIGVDPIGRVRDPGPPK